MDDNNNTSTDVNPPIDRRIEQHISGLGLESGVSEEQVAEMINAAIGELDTGTGNGPGDTPPGLYEDIEKTHSELAVAHNPRNTRILKTGPHQDPQIHKYGAWGNIVETSEDVQFRNAKVHSSNGGNTVLEIIEIDYEPPEIVDGEYAGGGTYDLGRTVATREFDLDPGEQTIAIEATIPEGQHFITRNTENPQGDIAELKRTVSGVNWDDFNANHDIPITFKASWQVGRRPGTDAFNEYINKGWDSVLYYYADPEFGYMGE